MRRGSMLQDGMIEPSGLQCVHGGSRSHTGFGKHKLPCVEIVRCVKSWWRLHLKHVLKKTNQLFSQRASHRLIPDLETWVLLPKKVPNVTKCWSNLMHVRTKMQAMHDIDSRKCVQPNDPSAPVVQIHLLKNWYNLIQHNLYDKISQRRKNTTLFDSWAGSMWELGWAVTSGHQHYELHKGRKHWRATRTWEPRDRQKSEISHKKIITYQDHIKYLST